MYLDFNVHLKMCIFIFLQTHSQVPARHQVNTTFNLSVGLLMMITFLYTHFTLDFVQIVASVPSTIIISLTFFDVNVWSRQCSSESAMLVNISTSSPPSYPLFDHLLASFEQCTNNFTIRHTVTALYTQADHVTV